MPREQRTNLKKTAGTEVPLGEFKSGVSGSVEMPVVSPVKSTGQALAEGLGLAAKGLATIGQSKIEASDKRKAISQRAKGTLAGRTEAYRLIAEAKENEVALDALGENYAKGIGNANATLGQADNINPDYFSSYMTTLGNVLASEQAGNEKILLAKQVEQDAEEMNAQILQDFETGTDGTISYTNLQDSHLNMTNAEYGKFYVSRVAAIIKQKHQDDPTYDTEAAINKHLAITTKDGVKFAEHPVYGKMIDTLETSISTTNKARLTAADDAERDRINNWTNESVLLLTLGNPTPKQIAAISEDLQAATTEGVATEKFSKVANALSVYMDRGGFGKNSDPAILNVFKRQASQGNLNQELLNYNKHKINRDDFLSVLSIQSKYDNDYRDETKRQAIEGLNKARAAGKSLVADINQFGMIMGDQKAKARVFEYEQQFELYVQSYMDSNNNERPPGDVAFKKAQEIAAGILGKQQISEAAPNINNYTIISPFLTADDMTGLKQAIEEGKFTKEEAAAAYKHFMKSQEQ